MTKNLARVALSAIISLFPDEKDDKLMTEVIQNAKNKSMLYQPRSI